MQIAIRFEPQHFRALEVIAEVEDRSIAAVARRIIVAALDSKEKSEFPSINKLLRGQ